MTGRLNQYTVTRSGEHLWLKDNSSQEKEMHLSLKQAAELAKAIITLLGQCDIMLEIE